MAGYLIEELSSHKRCAKILPLYKPTKLGYLQIEKGIYLRIKGYFFPVLQIKLPGQGKILIREIRAGIAKVEPQSRFHYLEKGPLKIQTMLSE